MQICRIVPCAMLFGFGAAAKTPDAAQPFQPTAQPASAKDEMRSYFTEGVNPEALRECRDQLEKTANLTLYTPAIAMDDLDAVRAALGYDKINLLGGSYDHGVRTSIEAREQWPRGKVAASFTGPVKFDAPILMITRDLDPVTPPWLAAGAGRLLQLAK